MKIVENLGNLRLHSFKKKNSNNSSNSKSKKNISHKFLKKLLEFKTNIDSAVPHLAVVVRQDVNHWNYLHKLFFRMTDFDLFNKVLN